MQWTTLKFYKIFTTRCIISALSFVLFLGISPPAVANDLTNDVSFIRAQLETLLADLNSGVSTLSGDIVGVDNTLNNYLVPLLPLIQGQGNTLSSVLSALNGSSSSSIANRLQDLQFMINGAGGLYQYENIFGYLNEIAQNTANSGSTNIYNVQVDARDILAGNPWWNTNSVFVLTYNQSGNVQPVNPNNVRDSFPEFMSRFASLFVIDNQNTRITRQTWEPQFGYVRQKSGTWQYRPYNFFDWMADATRSNWVLQASAIQSASTDADYIVNHLDLLLDALSSSESVAYSNYLASSSNLVLVSQNVTSNELVQFAEADLTDDDSLPPTNGLASLTLVAGSISGTPFGEFESHFSDLVPSFNEGRPNLVVIPEMTIGGVHVPIGQADFLSRTPSRTGDDISSFLTFVSSLCRWAWRLMCFVGLFYLVKQEWDYWSTLGGSASG